MPEPETSNGRPFDYTFELPLTPVGKLKQAHKLLADASQAMYDTPDGRRLIVLMAGIEAIVKRQGCQ
jgi:hypothetical protein